MGYYSWGKYNLITSPYYTVLVGSQTVDNPLAGYSELSGFAGYTDYSLNSSTGVYSLTGSYGNLQNYSQIFTGGGSEVTAYSFTENMSPADTYTVSSTPYSTTVIEEPIKGSYVGVVTSPNVGSYPTNGNMLGYWYIYIGYTSSTAPTVPTSITLPAIFGQGTSAMITWGASTDVDGNLSGYRLERQYNGGSWSQICQGADLNYTDTVGTDWTTVAYRVKAYDADSLESAYQTSSTAAVIGGIQPKKDGAIVYGKYLRVKVEGIVYDGQLVAKENGVIVRII